MTTRVLIASLLAVAVIQPAAAGTGTSSHGEIAAPPPVLEVIGDGGMAAARAFWVRQRTVFSTIATRRAAVNHALLNSGTGRLSPCSATLALGSEAPCVGGCDAARESCNRQCDTSRGTCMAQCPGLGFACDAYCQAAYLVCKGNCGRAHDACVTNCRGSSGEKN